MVHDTAELNPEAGGMNWQDAPDRLLDAPTPVNVGELISLTSWRLSAVHGPALRVEFGDGDLACRRAGGGLLRQRKVRPRPEIAVEGGGVVGQGRIAWAVLAGAHEAGERSPVGARQVELAGSRCARPSKTQAGR